MSFNISEWDVTRILHNADLLYNEQGRRHLGVDQEGDLQVNQRWWPVLSFCCPEEMDTREFRIREVCVRTLREILNAVESGKMDGAHIVQQRRNIGGSAGDHAWVDRRKFGMEIANAPWFMEWMPTGEVPDEQLTPNQRFRNKIVVLTSMLIFGKAAYKAEYPPGTNFFDTPGS